MVDFRRMIPVLAVIAFLLGSAVTASAQVPVFTPFTCSTQGVPFNVRAEGITEPLGDYVINCTGGTPTTPGAPIPQANLSITLNVNLTSRLLGSSTAPQAMETLLLLDEPVFGSQFACGSLNGCPGFGNGLGTANAPSTVGYYGGGTTGSTVAGCASTLGNCPGNNRNVFQGQQTSAFTTTFVGVPIDPPGTSGSRIVRITNLRGNANQLGASGSGFLTPIQAQLTASPSQFIPVNNPVQTVAFIQRGLTFSVPTSTSGIQQCLSRGTGATNVATIRYVEGFPTAFKKRFYSSSSANPSNVTGGLAQNTSQIQNFNLPLNQNTTTFVSLFNNESMFVNPFLALPSGAQTVSPNTTAGLADFGTRVKAVFNNLPNGTSIFVSTDAVFVGQGSAGTCSVASAIYTSCSDHFRLTSGTESGPYAQPGASASPGGGLSSQLTVVNNSATAVWEDLDSDPSTTATVNFNVWITFTANPGATPPVPSLVSSTVNGSFAPISTTTTAQPTGITVQTAVPRFADTSSATVIFTIVPCVTNLLFPFITTKTGFDTGIAISNTSKDNPVFATPNQTGTCTLNWFGEDFTGATAVTPNVLPGTTFTALSSTVLSSVANGFTGYMIAQCRFQYAHGFAFVSDLGARNFAMGYLALIIPDPGRTATPFPCGGNSTIAGCATSGEQLGF